MKPGLIARFQELARVPAPNRQSLAPRTIETYTHDVTTIQELLGHESLETTMIYLHGDAARGVSPLDVAPASVPRRVELSIPLLT